MEKSGQEKEWLGQDHPVNSFAVHVVDSDAHEGEVNQEESEEKQRDDQISRGGLAQGHGVSFSERPRKLRPLKTIGCDYRHVPRIKEMILRTLTQGPEARNQPRFLGTFS
jgi:hypothetical protein